MSASESDYHWGWLWSETLPDLERAAIIDLFGEEYLPGNDPCSGTTDAVAVVE